MKLEETYKYDSKVTTQLIAVGRDNMDDVRMAFDSAKEVTEQVVAGIADFLQPVLQAARLNQAWTAVCSAHEQQVAVKRKGPEAIDVDVLLDSSALNHISDVLYARYHLRLAPDQEPSDYLVGHVLTKYPTDFCKCTPIGRCVLLRTKS